MRAAIVALLALPVTASAGQQWRQEGADWVFVEQGAGCENPARVKVVAGVRLSAETGQGPSLNYTWTWRGPAASQAEAQGRQRAAKVTAVQRGQWCVVTAAAPGGEFPAGEFRVTVPASVTVCRLETRSGNLRVQGIRGEIFAATGGGNVELEQLAGEVTARTGGGRIIAGRVDGSLHCLSGGGNIRVRQVTGEAILESAGGEIYVGAAGGRLRLSTAGNIRVDQAAADVFAFTRGGLIDIGKAAGMVTAENAGGGIQIGPARGVRCESARGTIRLTGVSGSVRANTAYGHVFATLAAGQRLEDSILSTGRGDITVSVPSNLAVTVKALNETAPWAGQVISEFSEIQARPADVGAGRPVAAFGSLNGGGPVLMLSTTNGSIYLKRQR
jgi:hypothetical protein